jgi:hypothetical protein
MAPDERPPLAIIGPPSSCFKRLVSSFRSVQRLTQLQRQIDEVAAQGAQRPKRPPGRVGRQPEAEAAIRERVRTR